MFKSRHFWKAALPFAALLVIVGFSFAQTKKSSGPLKVLLIAGGCCHDYAVQTKLLKAGIEARLKAEVTIEYNPDTTVNAKFKVYDDKDWAKNYDVIIHDECSANVTEPDYVNRILDAHKNGTPAVNLHCAMHSYRWGNFKEPVKLGADNAGWYEMIGLQSTGHGPKTPIDLKFESVKHPAIAGLEDWTTVDEELYNNVQIFEGTTALVVGHQMQKPKKKKGQPADPNAKPTKAEAVVVWASEYGPKKTKIFSTSLGHTNDTVADDRYLDLITQGLLWATGNINEDGTPANDVGR